MLIDSCDYIFEEDLGGECMAMIYDGFVVRTVPGVH